MQKYINIHIHLFEENYEIFFGYMLGSPFTGIEEKLDELIITFPYEKWNFDLKTFIENILKKIDANYSITKEEIIDEINWNEEWEKNVPVIIIDDKIGIAPSWKIEKLATPLKIIINPKMSFGTGEHASTRLICKLAENTIKPGTFWIDAGTGSGVLAILAVKLGASKVLAFDNNLWSINNSTENFKLNHVDNDIVLLEADVDSFDMPPAQGIMANLFSHLIIGSLDKFYTALKKSKGDLLVSGILVYNKDDIIKAAMVNGFQHIESLEEEEWTAIHLKAL